MGLDSKTLAAAKSYIKKSMQGAGAVKGEKGDPGKDGKDAPTILSIDVNEENNNLTIILSDGTSLNGGTIKTVQGENGKDGISVPKGGQTGQILVKKSENDYDTEWKDISVDDDSDKYTMVQGIL